MSELVDAKIRTCPHISLAAIKGFWGEFYLNDLERARPSISRDMIRVVLNRLRKEGRPLCKGTCRNALWEKRGNNAPKRGNLQ